VILGPVIVDFFAPSAMLVVEVDGAVHARRRDADRVRDEALARRGIRVLRVEAQLVEARVDLAVDMVRRALAD
jgi:very-short-patch-repair endonuclease